MGGGEWCQRGGRWNVKRVAGVTCVLLVGVAVPVMAAEKTEVDAEFLEFLGSVDSVDEGWNHYLENTDLDKVGRQARQPPANREPVKQPRKEADKGSEP